MFWDRFIRRVFSTLGSSLWSTDAAGRVLDAAHPFFVWDQLDPVSLSILRQCYPPKHPLRRAAQEALARQLIGSPIDRAYLLLRLTSLGGVDEKWVLAQRRLEAVPRLSMDGLQRAFLPRILTLVSRLQLAEVSEQRDFALRTWAEVASWFLENPDAARPLSCVLFRHVLTELSRPPEGIPPSLPAWFGEMSVEERRFLCACVDGQRLPSRAILYLSFYIGMSAEQIRAVMSGWQATSIEEIVEQLERAYIEVLDRMRHGPLPYR